jgi:hypothetical protein
MTVNFHAMIEREMIYVRGEDDDTRFLHIENDDKRKTKQI